MILFTNEPIFSYITWPPYLYSKFRSAKENSYIFVNHEITGQVNHYGVCLLEIDSGIYLAGKSDQTVNEHEEQWAMRVYYWLKNSLPIDDRIEIVSCNQWLARIISKLLKGEYHVEHLVIGTYTVNLELPKEFLDTAKMISRIREIRAEGSTYNIVLPTRVPITAQALQTIVNDVNSNNIGLEPIQIAGDEFVLSSLNFKTVSPETLDELIVLLANATNCIVPKGGSWLTEYAALGGCSIIEMR
ncbi:MAG: hypothetical protein AB2651_20860 [Candidatus Thiodiazotropha sp.]